MSKLANEFMLKATYYRTLLPEPDSFPQLSVEVSKPTLDTGLQYKAEVKINYTLNLPSDANKALLNRALENVKDDFCDKVYGEFRGLIYELQRELMCYGNCRVKEIVNELERRMFNETV